ncbi:MAG: radical SAM protein [Nitrososphaeria archaeon]|jgi:magnesium-protoporphyrin IX monomethyl ester (oxidative) cyclase
MRVALVSSPGLRPLEIYQSIGVRSPPLGLAYIGAVLEGAGHQVMILDAPTQGMGVDEAAREVLSWRPDVVGISAVTPTAKGGYRLACAIKSRAPDLPIVMGGQHVSFMFQEALSTGCVDYVAIGEGERTMAELVEAISGARDAESVDGLALPGPRLTRPRRPIENLDELPEPARHLLPMDEYTVFDKPVRIIHVIASRGCPYGCIYCSTSYYWGRRYRIRSARLVADEIERATQKYGTNIVVFADDELTLSHKWVYEFLDELDRRKLDISWTCGTRVSSVNRDLLERMRAKGCNIIYYGVESYNDEDLLRIRKKITTGQVQDAVRATKEAGMEVAGSFVLGFPWQRVEDVRNTVKFAERLNLDYAQFTVATPYPGTPLYEEAVRDGLIEVWDWDYYTTVYPVMRGMYIARDQMIKLLGWAYRKFYMRPSYLLSQLRKNRLRTMIDMMARAIGSAISSMRSSVAPRIYGGLEEYERALIEEVRSGFEGVRSTWRARREVGSQ